MVLAVVAPMSGWAASGPSIGGDVVVPPAPDYATEMRGNPFDYSDAADLLTDGYATDGWAPVKGATAKPTFSNGMASWTMQGDGHVFPVWMTFPGALPEADDGWWTPIDADRYTKVAVRLYASAVTSGAAIDFWHCNEPLSLSQCAGRVPFTVQQGWHTYVFDLAAADAQFAQWIGEKIGLQLTLNQASGTTFKLDWLRIYQPTQQYAVGGVTGVLRWDRDTSTANNTASNADWGVLPDKRFDVGAFPPGTYHLLDDQGYGDTITILDGPQPRILDPDAAGGDDYATVTTGDTWDFSQSSDVVQIGGAGSVSWSGGVLEATNTTNDPFVQMRLGPAIDADRYHRLTVRTSYDGQFDLADAAGGGAHGRIVFWTAQGGDWNFVNSRELVTFTDRTTYTYDLADARIKSTEAGEPAWDGAVTYFRWDPNEDPGSRRWRVDEIRLAADDEAAPAFDIRWLDTSHVPGTTVTIGLDGNRRGFNGRVVASGISQSAGTNTYRLDARDLLPGTYWVWVRADDGAASTSTYASGPLVVSDRIAGRNRVATALEVSRAAFPSGADTAAIATADTFADALAGAQLAAAANAPILLTGRDRLDATVAAELQRLGVDHVYLLGGAASLSEQVRADVEALGVTTERLSGTQRELTAVAIAREAVRLWQQAGESVGDPLVARAFDFPDALSAGQLVAAARSPILLIPRDRPAPAAVHAFVEELDPSQLVAVGGAASVPTERLDAIADGRDTGRISGKDRHATAVAVRAAAVAAGADGSEVVIASGRSFPDALAAAGLVAVRGATLLTSDTTVLPAATEQTLRATGIDWYRLVGGAGTLTPDVAAQVAGAT